MKQPDNRTHTDVAIIGAGPIGLELAVCLKRAGDKYLHFEARQNSHQGRITGEEYLAYLRGIAEQFDLQINTCEKVNGHQREQNGFTLRTLRRLYEMAGLRLEGYQRVPQFDPETMETNVPGLYLAGTTAAGKRQDSYRLFIEVRYNPSIPLFIASIHSFTPLLVLQSIQGIQELQGALLMANNPGRRT